MQAYISDPRTSAVAKAVNAVVRRSSIGESRALTSIKSLPDFNGGKGQKSYMDGFHRNVTVT
jgi:hypothetical protein